MFISGRSILSAAYRNKLIKAKRNSRCNGKYFNCIQWTLFDRCEEISSFDLYRRKLKLTINSKVVMRLCRVNQINIIAKWKINQLTEWNVNK